MGLRYDPQTHTYWLGKEKLPGVTEILRAAGFSYAFYREGDGDTGTYGHQVLQMYLAGTLESYDPAFEPWMTGIRMFMKEERPEVFISPERGLERILYSDRYKYAGTLDFAGVLKRWRGKVGIADWKFWGHSSRLVVDTAGLQSAAYGELFREYEFECMRTRMPRAAVHFFPGGYSIFDLRERQDWDYFLSALNCWRWRKRHGQIKG